MIFKINPCNSSTICIQLCSEKLIMLVLLEDNLSSAALIDKSPDMDCVQLRFPRSTQSIGVPDGLDPITSPLRL